MMDGGGGVSAVEEAVEMPSFEEDESVNETSGSLSTQFCPQRR